MKVLLFANDLLPFGELPTSGGGLRCYQLMRGLQAHGVEVVVSMPGFTYLAEKHRDAIPEEVRAHLWHWGQQDAILRRTRPDVVLFASNWDHYNLLSTPDVPVVIDLHGSRLVETRIWGNPVDPNHKLRVLSQADCLLCAGVRQRSYFYGWLLQAGRVPADEHFIRYLPISQDPQLPAHACPGADDPRAPVFVSGGGWFPWQDQSRTIFAACHEVARRGRGTVHLFGTPHESVHVSAEERAIRATYRRVQELASGSDRIRVSGYVGRQQLLEVYRGASVALEAMRRNVEREIAFTTRTIEYLWCGLPVVYNDYSEIADHIREYDAGWTVDPDSDIDIASALDEVFDAAVVRRKGENAQRLVRDRFTWEKTIAPLLDFVRAPRKAPAVKPALGSVSVAASYLSPRGIGCEVPLGPGERIRQPLILPDDGLEAVSLAYSPGPQEALRTLAGARIELLDGGGRRHASRRYTSAELAASTELRLRLPRWRRQRGGARLVLDVALQPAGSARPEGTSPARPLRLDGLQRPAFPLLAGAQRMEPSTGAPEAVAGLAVRFIAAQGLFGKIRFVTVRAFQLLRGGQGRLLLYAAARRMPRLASRVRALIRRGEA